MTKEQARQLENFLSYGSYADVIFNPRPVGGNYELRFARSEPGEYTGERRDYFLLAIPAYIEPKKKRKRAP